MSENTIVPSPTFDLPRVAEAIRRQVRLDLDPVYAKAAVHGLPVELTEDESRQVAAVALAALVAAHPIDGKKWLIAANQEWAQRADQAAEKHRNAVARNRVLRGRLVRWQQYASWSWAWFLWQAAHIDWHWPLRTAVAPVLLSAAFSAGIRFWRLRPRTRGSR